MSTLTDLAQRFNKNTADMIVATSAHFAGLPQFLGIKVVEMGPGWLTAEVPVRKELITPVGNMHGGVLAGFVDHILGTVMYPLMGPGQWAATTEFKLNYLAPVKQGILEGRAEVMAITRTTAVVRADVSNEGRMVCTALGTLLIRDPKKA